MTLQIQGIGFSVGGRRLFADVTAAAGEGELIGLVGPNGAGKSTLFDIIGGFVWPDQGKVMVDGREVARCPPEVVAGFGVGRTFQQNRLPWNLTVAQCLRVARDSPRYWCRPWPGGGLRKPAPGIDVSDFQGILSAVDLDRGMDTPCRELSFGQHRLLQLVMAVARPTSVLLLDEPLSGLRDGALRMVLDLLVQVAKDRVVIVADHALSAVGTVASRVWFLNRGRLGVFAGYEQLAVSEDFCRDYLGGTEWSGGNQQEMQSTGVIGRTDTVLARGVSSGMEDVVLECEDVAVAYGSKEVISSATVSVHSGEIVAIIGLNGSGKSTLLYALAGLLALKNGVVRLAGHVICRDRAERRARKGIRLLVQEHRLFRNLTLRENLRLSADGLAGRRGGQRGLSEGFEGWNTASQLADGGGGRLAFTYSGGEQARVALASLQFGDVRVVLMDEPTVGLDGVGVGELHDVLRWWTAKGVAVVLVEHSLEFVASVADRVLVLAEGRLVEMFREERWNVGEMLATLKGG